MVQQRRQSMALNVLLVLWTFCWGSSQAKSSPNSCHASHFKDSPAPECQKITLPQGLCSSCDIGPIDRDGAYVDCTRTMETELPICGNKIQAYLDLNPCDTARLDAWQEFQSSNPQVRERGRQKLDFFLYSVCEQSCDCIPLEASEGTPQIQIRRGNCQAHLFYDVCRILPRIRLIRGEGTKDDDVSSLEPVCPSVRKWFRSPDSKDWPVRQDHQVSPTVAYFLERVVEASQLTTDTTFWKACFRLESAQNRIQSTGEFWQVLPNQGRQPKEVRDGCFVWHGDKAYLIGGNHVNEYDPKQNSWTLHSSRPPFPITDNSQCVSLRGKIWFPALGSTMPTYDPVQMKWDIKAGLPFRRQRANGASIVYQDRIYTSHGRGFDGLLSEYLDVYDPDSNKWSPLANILEQREYTGGGLVTTNTGEIFFCVSGGRGNSFSLVAATSCYHFGANSWVVKPDIPTPRYGGNYGTTCDGRLMVAGGMERPNLLLNDVEVFNGHSWTTEPSISEGRQGTGIAIDCQKCGNAYLAGGISGDGNSLLTVEASSRGTDCNENGDPMNRRLECPGTSRISQNGKECFFPMIKSNYGRKLILPNVATDDQPLQLSRDGTKLVVGGLRSEGRVVVFRRLPTGAWARMGRAIVGGRKLGSIVEVADEADVIVVTSDENIRTFQYQPSNMNWVPTGSIDGQHSFVHVSRDGRLILTGQRGTSRLYQNFNETTWSLLAGPFPSSHDGTLSEDGNTIALANEKDNRSGTKSTSIITVFQMDDASATYKQKGKEIIGQKVIADIRVQVAVSADGSRIVVGETREGRAFGSVTVYEYNSISDDWVQLGQRLQKTVRCMGIGRKVRMSADGMMIAASCSSGGYEVLMYRFVNDVWVRAGSPVLSGKRPRLLEIVMSGEEVYIGLLSRQNKPAARVYKLTNKTTT